MPINEMLPSVVSRGMTKHASLGARGVEDEDEGLNLALLIDAFPETLLGKSRVGLAKSPLHGGIIIAGQSLGALDDALHPLL